MTLRQFVEYLGWLRGMRTKNLADAASTAIARVSLSAKADAKLSTLSGGMLRRAGLAQALVHSPGIILLDEPTAGLDPQARLSIRSLLSSLAETTTIVVTTHILEDVQDAGSSLVILSGKKMAYVGDVRDLLCRYSYNSQKSPHMSRLESAFLTAVNLASE